MSIATLVATAPLRRGMKSGSVQMLQEALRAAGHELVADGDFGTITEAAVKRFQAAHGLTIDGIVGPQTAKALDAIAGTIKPEGKPEASVLSVAPWLSLARALTGTKEIPGKGSNPLIIGWRNSIIERFPELKKDLSWYVDDDTPWCGLFAAHCVAEDGHRPPDGPLWALNWRNFGVPLASPALGCVLVFSRNGGGHVAFYEGEDATAYHIRGGNQSNAITLTRIAKNRLAKNGIRWPKYATSAQVGSVVKAASGSLSLNEA